MSQDTFDFDEEAAERGAVHSVSRAVGGPVGDRSNACALNRSHQSTTLGSLSVEDELPQSTWKEVPQARFLSWPLAQQLNYCAARDEDAALHEPSLHLALFHQERARMYREMLCP